MESVMSAVGTRESSFDKAKSHTFKRSNSEKLPKNVTEIELLTVEACKKVSTKPIVISTSVNMDSSSLNSSISSQSSCSSSSSPSPSPPLPTPIAFVNNTNKVHNTMSPIRELHNISKQIVNLNFEPNESATDNIPNLLNVAETEESKNKKKTDKALVGRPHEPTEANLNSYEHKTSLKNSSLFHSTPNLINDELITNFQSIQTQLKSESNYMYDLKLNLAQNILDANRIDLILSNHSLNVFGSLNSIMNANNSNKNYSQLSMCSINLSTGKKYNHRFKLILEGDLQICKLQHSRNVISKLLNSKLLRRWKTHRVVLTDTEISSDTVRLNCLF